MSLDGAFAEEAVSLRAIFMFQDENGPIEVQCFYDNTEFPVCPTPAVANRSEEANITITVRAQLAGAAHDYPMNFYFKYFWRPFVETVTPFVAPVAGGTAIFVRGVRFRHQMPLFCVWFSTRAKSQQVWAASKLQM